MLSKAGLHLVNADKARDGLVRPMQLLSVAIAAFEGALKLNRELGVAMARFQHNVFCVT